MPNDEKIDIKKDFNTGILKQELEKGLITGVVLEPETEDSQGDVVAADVIESAAHEFMVKSRIVGLQHGEDAPAQVVESFIAPSDMMFGEQLVKKGAWLMTVKVLDVELWGLAKAGEFTGFSVGGWATRSEQ